MVFLIPISGLLSASSNVGDSIGVDENSGYSRVTKEEKDDWVISEDSSVWG